VRILNLYAGIGGNRKLWGTDHEITAVELNENIARVYADYFPTDTLIIGNAHDYLLEHYSEFDFIWSSPPCQSHSQFRQKMSVAFRGSKPVYPDMKLYEEIIFLKHNFKGKWVVENVQPYYEPLIKPDILLDRHYFWSNLWVWGAEFSRTRIRTAQVPELEEALGYDLSGYKGLPDKRQVLRNCCLPSIGKYFLDSIEEGKE
jgi:DNA (cytosine-5)-methyltransferase 1